MISPCLTLIDIRYVSRAKWENPGKGVVPSPTPRCSSFWKESLLVTLDWGHQLYFLLRYGRVNRVFANGLWDWGSIPGRLLPNTKKMVLDDALLNIQHYKVWIESKVEQSKEWRSVPLHLGVVAIEKEAFGSPLTKVTNFTFLFRYE